MRISYWSSDVCSSDLGLDALGLGGKGRKVAVIDSGVDVDHADLAGRLVDEACFCSPVSGGAGCCPNMTATQPGPGAAVDDRSAQRRVGKECGSTWRSRWGQSNINKHT